MNVLRGKEGVHVTAYLFVQAKAYNSEHIAHYKFFVVYIESTCPATALLCPGRACMVFNAGLSEDAALWDLYSAEGACDALHSSPRPGSTKSAMMEVIVTLCGWKARVPSLTDETLRRVCKPTPALAIFL